MIPRILLLRQQLRRSVEQILLRRLTGDRKIIILRLLRRAAHGIMIFHKLLEYRTNRIDVLLQLKILLFQTDAETPFTTVASTIVLLTTAAASQRSSPRRRRQRNVVASFADAAGVIQLIISSKTWQTRIIYDRRRCRQRSVLNIFVQRIVVI